MRGSGGFSAWKLQTPSRAALGGGDTVSFRIFPVDSAASVVQKRVMTHKPIIAIDGPAASGKGTLARKLAAHLNYGYMDTGLLYRATAFKVLEAGQDPSDEGTAKTAAQSLQLSDIDNEDLRRDEVGTAASKVAAQPTVRQALLEMQKNFAQNPGEGYDGAILDGRDIGTVIAPEADIKLFITASVEIRAQRRLKELQSKGIQVTYTTVLDDMQARDARDAHTLEAHTAEGYRTNVLDSSDLSPEEMFAHALALIQSS